jgi:hypothetical protein
MQGQLVFVQFGGFIIHRDGPVKNAGHVPGMDGGVGRGFGIGQRPFYPVPKLYGLLNRLSGNGGHLVIATH